MDSEEVQWLKKRYRPTSTDVDKRSIKKIKFEHIKNDMTAQFSSKHLSNTDITAAISTAFPNTFSCLSTKSRTKHVFGLEEIPLCTLTASGDVQSSSREADIQLELQQLRLQVLVQQRRISELEGQLHEKSDSALSPSQLASQIDGITSSPYAAYHGPNTIAHFKEFSVEHLITEFKQYAPDVWQFVNLLGNTDRFSDNADLLAVAQCRAASVMCTLLKCRSQKTLGLQLLIGLMLIARATSRRAITVLSHAGICLSYTATWKYLLQLTEEAQYAEQVRSSHWLWIFDNVNLHQKVRHERQDHHSSMMNLTSRIAVRIQHLPQDIDWNDSTPQCSVDSLTIDHFMASESAGEDFRARAIQYTARYLVTEFSAFGHLKKYLSEHHLVNPVTKAEYVPMKVLFKDEKYTSETVDILSTLMKDAELKGSNQVVVGDQLTLKNIRSSKLWRQSEVESRDRLSWVNEIPGDFHFLWECLRVLYSMFWGAPTQVGSLCHLREVIKRNQVDKGVKIFNVGDEFLVHVFKAHFSARILTILGAQSFTDSIPHESSKEWLNKKAEEIVTKCIIRSSSSDYTESFHRQFLHHGYLYIDLREAIRWENGPVIVEHYKWWIPLFLATGCKNYACEAVHHIVNLTALYPKHIAYIATHNRTVNISGKPGHGKPLDQLMEHYNLIFKSALRSGGGQLTEKHVEEVSMAVFFLMEASKKTDAAFGLPAQQTSHTVVDTQKDIEKMAGRLLESCVTASLPDRQGAAFPDPAAAGWKKFTTTNWIVETIHKSVIEGDDDLQTEEDEVELYYELCDVF